MVFLDANILFSAALGGESFKLLWELAKLKRVQLYCSRYCFTEGEENLRRKYPAALAYYRELVEIVVEVSGAEQYIEWAETLINKKDAPVLAAARTASAKVLITGDTKDFGHLMSDAADLPFKVCTLRQFLMNKPV